MDNEAVYILRLWREGTGPDGWRASLEDLRTRRRRLYTDLDTLHAAIDERVAAPRREPWDDDG